MSEDARVRRILVATRDERAARELEATFAQSGVEHRTVGSKAETEEQVASGAYDAAIVDLALFDAGPRAVIDLLERAPDLALIALTRSEDTHAGVQAVRLGATDFVRTPLDRDEVRYVLAKSLRIADFSDAEPARSMRNVPRSNLIGTSEAMRELAETITRVANAIA